MPKPKKVVKRSVSKATSRTGSGSKRGGARRGLGGTITIASVSPSGNVGNPVPTVRAKVEAEGANLSKRDIRLYLDGAEQRRFYYGRTTGNLSYHPGMLSSGTHTVEIVAKTGQGSSTAKKAGPSLSLEGGQHKRIASSPWKLEAPPGAGWRFWPLPSRVRLAEHHHYYYCFPKGEPE